MTRKSSDRASVRSENLPTRRGELVALEPRLQSAASFEQWTRRLADPNQLVVLDLFSGAGGLSLGFEQAGFFVAAGLDHEPRAVQTHAANFLSQSRVADLAAIGTSVGAIRDYVRDELQLPRVDVLVGGPPCQGFALVGRAKIRSLRDDQRERLDARNHLYQEFLRFVEALRPLCFVMENVPQLATYENGKVAERIRDDFARLKYDVGASGSGDPWLLRSERFGVPETRQRLFFVGVRRGFTGPITPPRHTHRPAPLKKDPEELGTAAQLSLGRYARKWDELYLPPPRTLADAISDLPRIPAGATEHVLPYLPVERADLGTSAALRDLEYRALMRIDLNTVERELLFDHVVRGVRADDAEAFLHIPPGGTYQDVPEDYRRYRLEQEHFEDRYYRLPWDRPSRAITAHIAKDGYWYIHPDVDQVRTLSVREAARIQSFPDSFRFAGHRTSMYRQIGNAVPPLLAYAIAQRVREAIDRGADRGWTPTNFETATALEIDPITANADAIRGNAHTLSGSIGAAVV